MPYRKRLVGVIESHSQSNVWDNNRLLSIIRNYSLSVSTTVANC